MNAGMSAGIQFISGRREALDTMARLATRAQGALHLDAFKLGDPLRSSLADAAADAVTLRAVGSAHASAHAEVQPLARSFGPRAVIAAYGVDAPLERGVFNHAKALIVDRDAGVVTTAALGRDDVERIDWSLRVHGPQATAIADVIDATTAAVGGGSTTRLQQALADAATQGVYYNDPLTGATNATNAWVDAVRGLDAGDELLVATKKLSGKRAAQEIVDAHERGVDVHVVAGRLGRKGARILEDGNVDVRSNAWPGASLHGNMTVAGDQLLLGSLYLTPDTLVGSTTRATRELLAATRDANAVTDARRAFAAIPLAARATADGL